MHASSTSELRSVDRRERVRRVVLDLARQRTRGEATPDDAVLAEHPDLMPELADELQKLQQVANALRQAEEQHLGQAWERLQADWLADAGSTPRTDDRRPPPALPEAIGRYRVLQLLAEGGFGRVYLARDEELDRQVAIKIAHDYRGSDPKHIQAYLNEARIVARLDHPAIVPVYDVGRMEDGQWYVVSRFMPGQDLAARLRASRLAHEEAVRLIVAVAEALQYAHDRGLVHRDIKPANIVLDTEGRPYITDFGLALTQEEAGRGRTFAGTPAYMSPEQARGESHRVDARSDIFSLGVVLYELLTGQKPFQAPTHDELLDQIVLTEPVPPGAWAPTVPEELERICLKAISKRAADRYATARDFADDLRHWLEGTLSVAGAESSKPQATPQAGVEPQAGASKTQPQPPRVVPKGLRAFDAHDADFFLELLPGPRDRNGLPESIRLWKYRIEAADPDETFAVGVLYGPSGCGKSSLVRAGLLPRLAGHVETLYVEASPDDTEDRLLKRLRQKYPDLPAEIGLAECLAEVRRGRGPGQGRKVLLVLDQFEQWLHGKTDEERRLLVQTLRQCDGPRLQCLILVRDDFWLAVSRFMAELEIDLVQGHNTALVDLFDLPHAQKVLAEFGRSFGQLPENLGDVDAAQQAFVKRGVVALAQEGRVVPVRLALFADMVKEKPWTPATLRDVGGASGIGVAFLEETFSARTANPQYRQHERAARAVFESLLPEPGSDLRGRVRSYPELLDLSGYGDNPRAFKELMRILDAETRLVTPVDRENADAEVMTAGPGNRYYQLTHDYLVPSLREWLTKKRKSSRRGRAELRLAERTMMWNARTERRQLPSLSEWLAIRTLTRPADWTPPQKKMMRVARRHHATTVAVLVVLLLGFLLAGSEVTGWTRSLLMQLRARSTGLLLLLRQEQAVWPLLQHSQDPTLRTRVVHGFSPVVLGPEDAIGRLSDQSDVSIRRALVLVAGELAGDPEGPETTRSALRAAEPPQELMNRLQQLYQNDPDPGLHAAAEWTLRQYEQEGTISKIDNTLAAQTFQGDRQWYVIRPGHTMVVVPGPTEFLMGSPATELGRSADETLHRRRIRRSFSIASKETTVEQFQRFLHENPLLQSQFTTNAATPPNAPQTQVSWYEAAAYCNWLSLKEGLPQDQWCYRPNADGQCAEGMKLRPNALDLSGYRLPSEAEWEYACRAGAITAYYYGMPASSLAEYAILQDASDARLAAVGRRKPNDFGLFDMHGNVAEWCLDRYLSYPPGDGLQATGAGADGETIRDNDLRVLRGGSYRDESSRLRSAARAQDRSTSRSHHVGFRVARSYP